LFNTGQVLRTWNSFSCKVGLVHFGGNFFIQCKNPKNEKHRRFLYNYVQLT
jgi:hypothetical protein